MRGTHREAESLALLPSLPLQVTTGTTVPSATVAVPQVPILTSRDRARDGRAWVGKSILHAAYRPPRNIHAQSEAIKYCNLAQRRSPRRPHPTTRHTAHCKSATQDVQVHARAHHDSQNTSAPATTASADRRHTRSAHQAKREQSESKARKRSRTGQLALRLGTRLSRRHVRESALPAAPHTAAHAV